MEKRKKKKKKEKSCLATNGNQRFAGERVRVRERLILRTWLRGLSKITASLARTKIETVCSAEKQPLWSSREGELSFLSSMTLLCRSSLTMSIHLC